MKLIKTLIDYSYSQLKVLILGNFSNPKAGTNKSSAALVNGIRSTVSGLQLKRARTIEKFFIHKRINWRRISVRYGKISTNGSKGMNSSFIITNPN